MSTKTAETCEKCTREVMPDSKYTMIEQYHVSYGVWAYRCSCGHIWANGAQRKHNAEYLNRAIRDSKGIYM